MTFLAPALLALGLAVVVPLILHLFQRSQGPRVVFPALRYLRRAEREHATRIRLRQLLLLALRVLAILLVAGAAARPLLRSAGGGHAPTAVAIVLDNSLSSGAVVGERRVLDELRDAALATLDAAGPDDRLWLVRAGAPWEPALSGSGAELAEAVRETEPTAAAADLSAAVDRAAALLDGAPAGLAREIQLLSDLQASGLPRANAGNAYLPDRGPAVRVYAPETAPPVNRHIASLVVGGGVPVRAGERSTVAATVGGPADGAEPVPVRLVVDGVVRGAGTAGPGASAVLPLPARPEGWVTGHVETDPDAVRADDRRYFATRVLPPVPVAAGAPGPFLEEALASLESAGRIRSVATGDAAVVLATGARSADAVLRGAAVVVLPPASPVELGAANQRLASAGIPWRYGEPRAGVGAVDTMASDWRRLPDDVRLRRPYDLVAASRDSPGGDSVLVRLRGGEPWAVAGEVPDGGRYVVIGSPLTLEAGTLPTSTALVPLLDRAIGRWALGTELEPDRAPGERVVVDGDAVAGPGGIEPVTPGGWYRFREAGIYRLLAGTDTLVAWAVNPAAEESRLERVAEADLGARLGGREVEVAGPARWADVTFHDRLGREVTGWLLVALVLLLGLETAIAAAGRARRGDAGHDAHHAPPRGAEGNTG